MIRCMGYRREVTNQLFGGYLSELYRERSNEPFVDAFVLFQMEFGIDIFRSCVDDTDDEEVTTKRGTHHRTTSKHITRRIFRTMVVAIATIHSKLEQLYYGRNDGWFRL